MNTQELKQKIVEEFDLMFPPERQKDFFRFGSYRLVIRNFIQSRLNKLEKAVREEVHLNGKVYKVKITG